MVLELSHENICSVCIPYNINWNTQYKMNIILERITKRKYLFVYLTHSLESKGLFKNNILVKLDINIPSQDT